MCGIAGVFDFKPKSVLRNQHQVRSAIEKIKHRGPDDQGFYDAPNCSLGMCRLAIIDVKGGKQPSSDSTSRVKSVFNGEIYNFKDLRNLLKSRGYDLSGEGDSECIPYLYLEFGFDFPKLLQGMFAIGLWDDYKKLGLLVRDRLGKKPLWYKKEDSRITFASELKGLIQLNEKFDFEYKNLPEYLQFGYINAPKSIYKNVNQLKPGTTVFFEENQTEEMIYWDFPSDIRSSLDYEETKREAKSLITDAVRLRLVAERPIGVFLSGGVDSSLVTALMTRELGANTHSYSIGFDNPKFDESPHARKVADFLGIKHHERIIHPDPGLILNEIATILDQPFADSSIVPSFVLSKFASQDLVVALGGDGGDEVFGGYNRYQVTRFLSRLNFLLLLTPAPIMRRLSLNNRKLEKFLRHSGFQEFRSRYFGFQSLIQNYELSEFIEHEAEASLINSDLIELWNSIEAKTQLQKLQKYDMKSYLPGDLMYKADMASMAHGLELRSPLLDYRVVEFGLTLPDKFKIHAGVKKRLLRDILTDFLPQEIINRPKMGFGIPQADWLRNELADLVHSTLFSKDSFIQGFLNMDHLSQVVKKHKNGKNLDRIIWPILMLELWASNWLN